VSDLTDGSATDAVGGGGAAAAAAAAEDRSAWLRAAYRSSETTLIVLDLLDAFMEDFRKSLEVCENNEKNPLLCHPPLLSPLQSWLCVVDFYSE
jgi:hypothetical protein